MSVITKIRSWWKALAHRSVLENEIETELGQHIENYAADLMQSGMPVAEAVRRARMELGR